MPIKRAVVLLLIASAFYVQGWAMDAPPTAARIQELADKPLQLGESRIIETKITVVWSDEPYYERLYNAITPEKVSLRRWESRLRKDGEPTNMSILNEEGDWTLFLNQRIAITYPPAGSSSVPAAGASEDKESPDLSPTAAWKVVELKSVKVQGKSCWAVVHEVPTKTQEHLLKLAKDFTGLAGIADAKKFIPTRHRTIVNLAVDFVLAREFLTQDGMVVMSEQYEPSSQVIVPETFRIPDGFKKIHAATMDEFIEATKP